ncbi:tetratricopeptide repeat protein [Neobacillus sp. PS3-34]|uniref:tetratricopeptide repeat protein n=1 Tax=Neobacillus sp. PS3-34 TaxID=3070678 RepID=UPI0027DF205F|nr:tetratricopeptide repeat protein [Neobacillus sp. PS3-34]WML49996.1 tetratricopeptide repeat protein [Neobacillus sp. PS3-34]
MEEFEGLADEMKIRLKQESNNTNLINDFAIALMESRDYEGALLQFKRAVKIKPNIQSLNNLGYFYYTEGEPTDDGHWKYEEKKAIEVLERAIELKPSSYFPYNLLGEIYTSNGNYKRAIELLLMAISIQPTIENLNNLGVCYYKKSMLKEAAGSFKKAYSARRKDNLSLHPLLGYGICIAKLGGRDEALKIAKELLIENEKLEDRFDRIEDQIAFIYYLTDEFNEFVSVYSKLNLAHYQVDWLPPYLYSLSKLGEVKKIDQLLESLIQHKEQEIEETFEDDDDWEPGRKEEYIGELRQDIDYLRSTKKEIFEGKRQVLEYEPNIEHACYLFGCRRHNHSHYHEQA